MKTKLNNIKISAMINSDQYKKIHFEILKKKLNNEKGAGISGVIRKIVNFYFLNKEKNNCL